MAMAFDMHSPEINLIHVFQSANFPSCETISRTNLQLAALLKEIDRCEVKMSRNRMANVMRRPHFRLPIVLTRLNCVFPSTEVCHIVTIKMHNVLGDVGSNHRDVAQHKLELDSSLISKPLCVPGAHNFAPSRWKNTVIGKATVTNFTTMEKTIYTTSM